VAEVRVHPWYDSATFNNDIGTVRQGCQWLRSGLIPWYDSATFNNDIGTVRQGCQWLRSGFIPGTTVQHSTMI
jgi:hypothetical protein